MTMKIYRHTAAIPCLEQGSVVAIGNFDGVHLGHRHVLQTAKKHADELALPFVVLTFEPHPRVVFGQQVPRITPFAEKAALLRRLGVDVLYVARFNKQFAQHTPSAFVENVLQATLRARQVVVGEGFVFGKDRSGNVVQLQTLLAPYGAGVTVVPKLAGEAGEPVASTRVRQLLAEGDVRAVAQVLGRPFEVRTHLYEDEMLNLVGHMQAYAPIKNGVYWLKIGYTNACDRPTDNAPHPEVLAAAVVNGKIKFPPVFERPDEPTGPVTLQFVDVFRA